MSEVESFYWNKLSNKSFFFNQSSFLICVLFQLFSGVCLATRQSYILYVISGTP